jgi:signal transduction histidine kinase
MLEYIVKNKRVETVSLIILLTFLYFITGEISLELLNGNDIVTLGVFAPEGIALAFALIFGRRILLGIFLGQFLLALFNDINFYATFSIALVNTLEALLAIIIFNTFQLDRGLKHLRDMLFLISIIVFVLQPFSSFLGNLGLYLNSEISLSDLPLSFFSWWFGNIMGQLLFTPFLLLLFTHDKKIQFLNYSIYGVIFAFYIYFLEFMLSISNPFLLLILNIPFVIYITAYKGMLYGTLMSVITAIVTSFAIYSGDMIFHFNTILNYNLFVLLYTFIVLFMGVLFEERKEYERKLKKKIEKEVTKNKEQQLLLMQQSRLAQMGEMVSMIAHQWRQPLNNLSLVNQLLLSKYTKGKLNDDAISYFKENSKKQITLMSNTIDDFRNFFKAEKKEVVFQVNDIIEQILEILEPMYSNHQIKTQFIVDKSLSYEIKNYPNVLSQAILNLLNNAKDALSEKEDVSEKKIVIELYKKDNNVYIEIKDNAGGIAPDIIDKIFDPYFSTKEKKNGTGLGLYMSKMLLEEQLGGTISVHNENAGANFIIILKERQNA